MNEQLKAAVYGFAVGDALGVPYEFKSRKTFKCKGMTGFGTWDQPPGTWSDDTSMVLATCDSIRERGYIDPLDIMQRFAEWRNHAKYTAHGELFDIGTTTKMAIDNFTVRGIPAMECGMDGEQCAGNGSLMRILPVEFYLQAQPAAGRYEIIRNVSALTHAHICCTLGCFLYCAVAGEIIQHRERFKLATLLVRGVIRAVDDLRQVADADDNRELHYYSRIIDRSVYELPADEIESSGYVVDTLEAALWCLANTNSYRECLLWAVNLGEDADTVAAVAGSLAGLYYGYDSIPHEWLAGLNNKEMIVRVCG